MQYNHRLHTTDFLIIPTISRQYICSGKLVKFPDLQYLKQIEATPPPPKKKKAGKENKNINVLIILNLYISWYTCLIFQLNKINFQRLLLYNPILHFDIMTGDRCHLWAPYILK